MRADAMAHGQDAQAGLMDAVRAHDLNDLLAAIDHLAEAVAAELGRDHPQYKPVLEIRHLAELVARLPYPSHAAEAGTPLDQFLLAARPLLQRAVGEGVHLDYALGARTCAITLERPELERALLYIGACARESMPHGGRMRLATRDVRLSPRDAYRLARLAPGEYGEIRITDTGAGLPNDLETAAAIARDVGGTLAVYVEPGAGTTVRILLPSAETPIVA